MNSRNKLDTDKRESNNVTPAQKKKLPDNDAKFNLNYVTTVPCNNNKASESNNVTTAKTENNPDKTEEME